MSIAQSVQHAARLSGDLGIRTLDLQANIAALAGRVADQAATVERIGVETDRLERDQQAVSIAARESKEKVGAAHAVIDDSVRRLSGANADVVDLIEQVSHIHAGLGAFNQALDTVAQVAGAISRITGQVNLLALNATIEAARAGDAGRGFAVVAQEVKKLALETAAATATIDRSVRTLTGEAGAMLSKVESGVDKARAAQSGTRQIEALTDELRRLVVGLSTDSDAVSGSLDSIVASVSGLRGGIDALTTGAADNAADLAQLSHLLTGVSDDTNVLLQHMTESGVETEDSAHVRFALAAAADIGTRLEADLEAGRLSADSLFDMTYTPVPGSDPPCFDHPAVPFFTAAARPHQEAAARTLPGLFGLSLSDRGCFSAVQMPERSQPRRDDPQWNAEWSRVGRIFDDPVQQRECRTTQPFRIKAYRRRLASGEVLLLKQVIASIHIGGRHWGILQLAYADRR
jgi:methyl-accepting chemotaxis protein